MNERNPRLFNKLTRCITVLLIMIWLTGSNTLADAAPFVIEELEFKNSQVSDIIRALAEDSKFEMVLLIMPCILNQDETHDQYDPTDKYQDYPPVCRKFCARIT